jgi:outer membrane receptor for ferrienterochelin and colicins
MNSKNHHKPYRATRLTAICAASSLSSAALLLGSDASTETDESPIFVLDDFTVVSTATRTERLIKDVPIKTELIGGEIFDATAKYDIGQAIELLNGARAENNCQNCGAAEIQLLGLPGNYNQILIDGQPLFTGVASVYGIDQVPTIFVDRVEVVKGGGSALYGPGAVAGVINLIPEEPFESHGHITTDVFDIDGATNFTSQFSAFYVDEELPLKIGVYGKYSDQDPYDANDDGFTEIAERENQVIGTYIWYDISQDSRLRFNYQYLYEDRRGGDSLDLAEHEAEVAEAAETNYQWATVKFDQRVSSDFDYTLSTSAVLFQRDSYYGGTGEDPDQDALDLAKTFYGELESFIYYLDAQFNYYLGEAYGEHTLTFGAQYEDENLDDDKVDEAGNFLSKTHDAEYTNLGIYLQDQWLINESLELVPGIRMDKTNTLDDMIFSPRFAARYTATDEWTLRGNFSTGFLAPRIFDEDLHIESLGGTPSDIVNSDDLEEERSMTFAVGADFTPKAMNGQLVTSMQAYYTTLEDSFVISGESQTINGRQVYTRENSEGSTIYGLEWDLSYELNEYWSFNAGIAYNHTRYDEAQEVFVDVISDKYNKTPDWTGMLQANYTNPDFVDGFLTLLWTGDMEVAHVLETIDDEDYGEIVEANDSFVVNIGISKKFALSDSIDLTLRAGINNLFDDYQDDFDSGADRDPGYIYGARAPRTYSIGAKIDF